MPCVSEYPDEPSVLYIENPINTQMKQRLDHLTDLLCLACSSVGDSGKLPLEVALWWDDHLQGDRVRVSAQFQRKVDKLGGEELRSIEAILDSVK